MPTVANLAVDALRAIGVDTLFCLPGVQNDDFFNALVDARDIRPIVTRHEQGAAYMALGASQVTGAPAACCVVPGPGLLNASAALTSAYWAGGRVLALVGAIPDPLRGRGVGVLHELPDQTAVLRQVTKHQAYVRSGETSVAEVQGALDSLVGGSPRPVSVEVPVTAWNDDVDGALRQPERSSPALDPDAVDRAVAAIAGAERPLIVVGGGAQDTSAEVRLLAETLEAPVFTRRQGHGVLDTRHRLWVPFPVGRDLWAEADVVIGVGTRMEFPVMHWGVDDDLQIVQINLDRDELDRHSLGTIGVHGDAADVLQLLLAELPHRPASDRSAELAERRARSDAAIAHLEPQLGHLRAIRDVLPDDGVIVEDVMQVMFVAHLAFEFRHPRTFLTTGPAGTLGAAVAQAIGAQAMIPDRNVLAVVGDGGFLFTATELATAAQFGIPVTVLVFDNGGYANVRHFQRHKFGPDRLIAADLVNPDFVAFGRSFGVQAERADGPEALRPALERALAHDGPSLVVSSLPEVSNPWPFLRMGRVRGGSPRSADPLR